MKIRRFNDINENYADRDTVITKFVGARNIDLYSDYFGYGNDKDIDDLVCNIQWSYKIDIVGDSINGIIPNIISIGISLVVITLDDDGETISEEEINLNFNSENAFINIEDTDGEDRQVLPYSPKSINITKDESDKTVITVDFIR